jgi:hypothetical protein
LQDCEVFMGDPVVVDPQTGLKIDPSTGLPIGGINPKEAFMKILQSISAAAPSSGGGGGGGGSSIISPGSVGGTPPQILGGGAPRGMAAPTGGVAPRAGIPMPGGFSTGFSFPNKQARDAATVEGAIANVSQAIDSYKKNKEAKLAQTAQNDMAQVLAAAQSGDQRMLDLLIGQSGGKEAEKRLKRIEKGLGYIFPKEPGEPPPPEAKGVQGAIKQAKNQKSGGGLQPVGKPGGVAIPQGDELAALEKQIKTQQAQALLQKMRSDPKFLEQMSTGSTMSGEQMQQAELVKSGLALSKDQEAKLDEADKAMWQKTALGLTKMETDLQADALAAWAEISRAKIATGPQWARVNAYRDYLGQRKGIQQKKDIDQILKAEGASVTAFRGTQKAYSEIAKQYEKDNPELAEKYRNMAADYGKQADELEKRKQQIEDLNDLDLQDALKSLELDQ